MSQITIAFINLQSGVATTRGYFHYILSSWKYWLPHSDRPLRHAGDMLKDEQADIALFVEVSEKSFATGYRSQTDILMESSHMKEKAFFFPPRMSPRPWEGKAVISRHPLGNSRHHVFRGGILPRYMAETVVRVDGVDVSIFVVHLPLGRSARIRQIEEIIAVLKDRTGPLILAGDFNERQASSLERLLRQTPLVQMCHTKNFPSWNPSHPLDYIFLSKEFSVLECRVPAVPPFSDHAPLIVRAEMTLE